MTRTTLFVTLWLALPAQASRAQDTPRADDAAEAFFEVRVRPVLSETCFKCHGGKKTSGGLRVDSREALINGGENGPAVVPGEPDTSLLVKAVRYEHDDIKMPPDKPLPRVVADDFAAWVKAGAYWPAKAGGFSKESHWAFEPVRDVAPPPALDGESNHPIDRFVAAKLRERGLNPVGPADKRTLIRRATFDLTGLPPTPEEIDTFLGDPTAAAFERVVDRLLASPRYGERWGRHWMDVVRYADTAGDNADYPVPEARLYRDYIIDSFNADTPYDQFVREQLAGDVLAAEGPRGEYAGRVIATGFLALSRRYATAPEELWHLTLEDTVETTGRAFLGLTLRCARCHDHKFDPVTQRDYYALYGVFASTKFPYSGSEEFATKNFPRARFAPLVPPDEAGPKIQSYEERLKSLREEIAALEKSEPKSPKLGGLRTELRNLTRPGLPGDLPAAYAVREGTPVDETVHLKGDPAQRGATVPRNAPAFLVGSKNLDIPPGSSGRKPFAEWLTRPENPLTARVMVNRIWQHHFGRGVVGTPSNFGLRGEEPTHPELLDWLASRFVESGWSVKTMHRWILLSQTYQRSGREDSSCAATDPGNRLLWRFERRRLEAEAVRDAMLAVGGHLDPARPGPHPFPPISQWGWSQHNPFKAVYPSNHRTVYLMTQRIQRHPFLALFDGPDTNTTTDVRARSVVPLQALFAMNNPFVREQAEGLARRLSVSAGDPRARVVLAHELAWGRPPSTEEVGRSVAFVGRFAEEAAKTGLPPDQAEREAWVSFARVMLTANEFLFVE